ncbi:MAG: DUF2079 domain-containing protein [Actinobacteria bacterium]|nr:DUF2079 domain-containing protein [Actinomycetota bacterium]
MSSEPTAAPLERLAGSPPRGLAWCLARRWPLLVWGAMLGWSVALFTTVRTAYDTFQLPRFDLGNMAQAVASTAHGRPLEVTLATGEQSLRLASHIDPILALLAPFWILAPTPLTLAAVQIAACALGALPVFWLARRHLGSETTAALLALVYLFYPWLAWTALEAFHPVTLAIPLFLYAIWFLDSERVWAFAPFAVLALLTGELMGIAIAGLGLWYWLARGHRRPGLVIAWAGMAWTAFAVKVLVPAFRGDASPFYDRFASVGGSPEGLIRTVFTDPGAIAAALFTLDDFAYIVWLAIPLAGAFLLSPGLAVIALPQLMVNTLADSSPTTDPRTHYIAAIVPFLVAASVFGLARLPSAHRLPAAGFLLALCSALSLLVGQWLAIAGVKSLGYQADLPDRHLAAMRSAVEVVPDGAPLSTTNRIGAHLSGRRYVYSVPILRRAEWVVLDTWDPRLVLDSTVDVWDPARLRVFQTRLEKSPEWVTAFEQDGVLVFRKVGR